MLLAGSTANHVFYVRTLLSQRVIILEDLPTGILIRNGIDTVVPVAISALGDGGYLAQSALPSNWVEGDVVHLRISAVSDGLPLTQTEKLGQIGVSGSAIASSVRDELSTELARIDVAISTRATPYNSSPGLISSAFATVPKIFDRMLRMTVKLLGEAVTFQNQLVGSLPYLVAGVYQDAFETVTEAGETIISTNPICGFRILDLPTYPLHGDTIVARGRTHRVIEVNRDGVAGVTVLLHVL